jgi:hypothetical protein
MTQRIPVKDTGNGNVILQMWEVDAEEAIRYGAGRYVLQVPAQKAPPTKNPGGRGY